MRIQLRRKTATEWSFTDPVLLSGEIGVNVSTTPASFKIGDGVNTWSTLEYAGGDGAGSGGDYDASAVAITGGTITGTTISGLTVTTSTGTLTIANAKTLTVSQNVTLTSDGTGTRTLNIGAGGALGTAAFTAATAYEAALGNPSTNGYLLSKSTSGTVTWVAPGTGSGDALTSGTLAQFAPTTSAQLASVISDENGSGKLLFAAGTIAITAAKTLTVSNSLTLTATDGSTLAIGGGGTLGTNAYTSTAYAPLASPALTGTPVAPTAGAGTNTTQIATTAYVLTARGARTQEVDTRDYPSTIDLTGGSSSTAGLNTAISDANSAHIPLFAANGHYIIDGSTFNGTTNSLIGVAGAVGYAYPPSQLKIRGQSRGVVNYVTGAYVGGVVFDARTATGASGTHPMVLAFAAHQEITDYTLDASEWVSLGVMVEDLFIFLPSNSTFGGISMHNCMQGRAQNVSVWSAGVGSTAVPAVSTHAQSVGIIFPAHLNNAECFCGSNTFYGLYDGFWTGEHLEISDTLSLWCKNGVRIRFAAHGPRGNIDSERCERMLIVDSAVASDTPIHVYMNGEIGAQAGDPYSPAGTGAGIYDPNNHLRGEIKYAALVDAFGDDIPVSGGSNCNVINDLTKVENVSLTAGSGISVSGSYPAFTIAATGGGGGPTTIVSDAFTGTNGTSISGRAPSPTTAGSNWVINSGAWTIQGNQARQSTHGDVNYLLSVDCGVSDGTISADVVIPNTALFSFAAGVAFRVVDNNNYCIAALSADGTFTVYKVETGTPSQIGTQSTGNTITPSSTTSISVVLSGTSIIAKIDGVTKVSTASVFQSTATKHGLYTYSGSTGFTTQEFDNFLVTTP